MTRRSKLWLVGAAVVFTFINVAGAAYAAAIREPLHAGVHVALLFLGAGAYLVWRGATRSRQHNLPQPADERLEYLQRSVDALALELERLSEAQRFSDKLRAGQGETPPLKKDQ